MFGTTNVPPQETNILKIQIKVLDGIKNRKMSLVLFVKEFQGHHFCTRLHWPCASQLWVCAHLLHWHCLGVWAAVWSYPLFHRAKLIKLETFWHPINRSLQWDSVLCLTGWRPVSSSSMRGTSDSLHKSNTRALRSRASEKSRVPLKVRWPRGLCTQSILSRMFSMYVEIFSPVCHALTQFHFSQLLLPGMSSHSLATSPSRPRLA